MPSNVRQDTRKAPRPRQVDTPFRKTGCRFLNTCVAQLPVPFVCAQQQRIIESTDKIHRADALLSLLLQAI